MILTNNNNWKIRISLFCILAVLLLVLSGYPITVSAKETNTHTQNVMVTGYWNPTGKMITHFSTNKWLNPYGWQGKNWEGRGYDVYSYFPTPDTYNGTFEVDYQKTLADFTAITNQLHPVAIISFGAGAGPWEIEYNARNLNSWVGDGTDPQQPTPNPPDNTVSVNYVRHSSLPVSVINDAIRGNTSILAWVDWTGNPGQFLCEYMAYTGMWYHDQHNISSDPNRCYSAGFIHVANSIVLSSCIEAANITVRETIKYLDTMVIYEKPILIIGCFTIIAVVATILKINRKKEWSQI